MPFNWEDLTPEIRQRLAANNPELRAELHREKRYQQLGRARVNRAKREGELARKELEKELEIQGKYIQAIIAESNRVLEESFAFLHQPPEIYEPEPTFWEWIKSWFKKNPTA